MMSVNCNEKTINSTAAPMKEGVLKINLLAWGIASAFFFYQFILRVFPANIVQELTTSLGESAGHIGSMIGFYYTGYTCTLLFAGFFIDRFGLRLPLAIASLLCCLGCLLFVSFQSMGSMSCGRLLMGVGGAFGFLTCLKAIQLFFPERKRTLFIGITSGLGTLGATFGGAPLAMLNIVFGWENVVLCLAFFGLSISVLTFVCVSPTQKQIICESNIFQSVQEVLSHSQTWIIGFYGLLAYPTLSGFVDLWAPSFISVFYNVNQKLASGVVSLFYVGFGFGLVSHGYVSDLVQSHKKIMKYGLLPFIMTICCIVYVPLPFWAVYVLFVFLGFFGSAQIVAFTTVLFNNSKHLGATAGGVHNMLCMSSGVILQPLIGVVLHSLWSGSLNVDGLPQYSVAEYQKALTIIPVCLVAAYFLSGLMTESFKKE